MASPALIGVVRGSPLPDMACRCQVRGGLTYGFVSTLALPLEPGALRPPPDSWSGRKRVLLPSGVGGSGVYARAQLLGPASQQLVSQLELTKVPEQQNHSCN